MRGERVGRAPRQLGVAVARHVQVVDEQAVIERKLTSLLVALKVDHHHVVAVGHRTDAVL